MRMRLSAVLFLLPVLSLCLGCGSEPQHQGKSLSEWQTQLSDEDPSLGVQAAAALGQIGSEAVPALTAALQIEDETVRAAVVRALGRANPESITVATDALQDEAAGVRVAAVEVLGTHGHRAVETLISTMQQDEVPVVRAAAATQLGMLALQPDVTVPALTSAFGDKSVEVRRAVANALPAFGAETVPTLIKALREDKEIRQMVASELGSMGAEAKAAVPALIGVLADEDWQLGITAKSALAAIGPAATAALQEAAKSEDEKLRTTATEVLEKIQDAQ